MQFSQALGWVIAEKALEGVSTNKSEYAERHTLIMITSSRSEYHDLGYKILFVLVGELGR